MRIRFFFLSDEPPALHDFGYVINNTNGAIPASKRILILESPSMHSSKDENWQNCIKNRYNLLETHRISGKIMKLKKRINVLMHVKLIIGEHINLGGGNL